MSEVSIRSVVSKAGISKAVKLKVQDTLTV